jgi:serine phosphatase RsbU (regulator of sigma subunit)
MEGSMPLGFLDSAKFSVMRFEVEPGSRLVIASDDLAKAMSADGQLFGFARVLADIEADFTPKKCSLALVHCRNPFHMELGVIKLFNVI